MSSFNFNNNTMNNNVIGDKITINHCRDLQIDEDTITALKSSGLSQNEISALRTLLATRDVSADTAGVGAAQKLLQIIKNSGEVIRTYPGLILLAEHLKRLLGM